MKNAFFVMLAAVLGSVSLSGMAAEGVTLADRHAKMNVSCVQCHGVKTPATGAKVQNTACLTCHGSYDKLAEKTKALSPNPHKTHLGNVRCSDCHSGHQQSKLMCNDCHKFDLQVK